MKALRGLYGSANCRVHVGAAAREAVAKQAAGAYRVLHFATHGLLDNDRPLYSRVVLSPSGGSAADGGMLEAWEIMDLKLQSRLAVLSACETARGRVSDGEGMIGLSWALFIAGCPTTVASQWQVDSASTTRLMVAFHRQLRGTGKSGGMGPVAALRQAQLGLLADRDYRHPFYWAPFVLIGAGD